VATAPAIVGTDKPVTLDDVIARHRQLKRMGEYNERSGHGGYIVLGRVMQIVHEVVRDANAIDEDLAKRIGVSMDWRHFHNGPTIACTPDRQELLIIGPVQPLPEIPDPTWKQKMVEMPWGTVNAGVLTEEELKAKGITLSKQRMIKQRFIDHMTGTYGDFMVCQKLTQILFKMDGVIGMTTIDFIDHNHYTGESASFFLDTLKNGEAFIIGGGFHIAALKA
jgi:hypothetical protein